MTQHFVPAIATQRWADCNLETLRWIASRPLIDGFLNTKCNSLTLCDYGAADGLRGPDFTYGWIQGRGLEALVSHAGHFANDEPELAAKLDAIGVGIFEKLKALYVAHGHVYFCYDKQMNAIRRNADGGSVRQSGPLNIFTYSDAFAAKGLVAAAARYAPQDLPQMLGYLASVVTSIEEGCFVMDETGDLAETTLIRQVEDFGPRMILLGACGMLEDIGQPTAASFGAGFIEHILHHHLDPNTKLLRNVAGQVPCNVGHAIEFAGFSLAYSACVGDDELVSTMTDITRASFKAGFHGPGIALLIDAETGAVLDDRYPWWSLPETIRAAALGYRLCGDSQLLDIITQADRAFFAHYWRAGAGLSYQTRSPQGPIDFVPATPDLDPGYHTGLSLLSAIRAFSDCGGQDRQVHNGRC